MESIKIIEYNHSFAKALAEMWNKSGENWGGSNGICTEENIIEQEEGSGNLQTWLAMDGEIVAGYCSFSEYREDEGALYIPLLNVRPDYHKKGIGKKLVLTAVKKTIELGWPRLDLYTWPGNTKAVPVYKKCGFFWERRDDTTHLMNFIPTVLHTEAVSDFFKAADWYDDSKRTVEIKADGREENGFDYFEYLWEKDGSILRMEFERRGRGIRLIETDDYIISISVENLNLVFGKKYKVIYNIVNKSAKPLNIFIKGINNKNISFNFEKTTEIKNNEIIEAEFYINEISTEQLEGCTHPTVCSEIFINGKKAVFKMGIVPKFPAKLKLSVPKAEIFKNVEVELFLEIENNFNEKAVFKFELPENENITLYSRKFELELQPNERKSIPTKYMIKNSFLYNAELSITAELQKGETIEFSKTISAVLKGNSGIFGGKTEDGWTIVNGSHSVELSNLDNKITIASYNEDVYPTFILFPKLGKPYSLEFSKLKPEKVENEISDNTIIMRAFYKPKEFNNIALTSIIALDAKGILKHSYEITNISGHETQNEIWISECFVHHLYRAIIPYEGKFIEANDSSTTSLDYWDTGKLTESWIFSRGDKVARGICWSPECSIKIDNYYMFIENSLGRLKAGESKETPAFYISFDTFSDWKEFRAFAINKKEMTPIHTTDSLEFSINEGNPFVKESIKAHIKDYKQAYFDGQITLESRKGSLKAHRISFTEAQQIKEAEILTDINERPVSDILELKIDFDAMEASQSRLVFIQNEKPIQKEIKDESGMNIYTADNGILTIKAANEFSNAIYSLTYKKENEWLDSSFPTPGPKSWWNPWTGGIDIKPEKFMPATAINEYRETDFAELSDNFGNQWQGIKTTMKIEKNKTYKGMEINQYYMMLPGVPVLCFTAEIIQNTNTHINNINFINFSYLKLADDIKKGWFIVTDSEGKETKVKCGRGQQNIQSVPMILFGSQERQEKLMVYSGYDGYLGTFSNNAATASMVHRKMTIGNGSRVFMPPIFLILTEDSIPASYLLKDLENISFK